MTLTPVLSIFVKFDRSKSNLRTPLETKLFKCRLRTSLSPSMVHRPRRSTMVISLNSRIEILRLIGADLLLTCHSNGRTVRRTLPIGWREWVSLSNVTRGRKSFQKILGRVAVVAANFAVSRPRGYGKLLPVNGCDVIIQGNRYKKI